MSYGQLGRMRKKWPDSDELLGCLKGSYSSLIISSVIFYTTFSLPEMLPTIRDDKHAEKPKPKFTDIKLNAYGLSCFVSLN